MSDAATFAIAGAFGAGSYAFGRYYAREELAKCNSKGEQFLKAAGVGTVGMAMVGAFMGGLLGLQGLSNVLLCVPSMVGGFFGIFTHLPPIQSIRQDFVPFHRAGTGTAIRQAASVPSRLKEAPPLPTPQTDRPLTGQDDSRFGVRRTVHPLRRSDSARWAAINREIVENDPHDFEAWHSLAQHLNDLGEIPEAETALAKALEIAPENFEVQETAIRWQMCGTMPKGFPSWWACGRWNFDAGKFRDAIRALVMAVDDENENATLGWCHALLALAYLRTGKTEAAECHAETARGYAPDSSVVRTLLADLESEHKSQPSENGTKGKFSQYCKLHRMTPEQREEIRQRLDRLGDDESL